MPVFVYQATDRTGKLVEGTIEAKDESLVINRLHGLQLLPIKVEKEGVSKGLSLNFSLPAIFDLQYTVFPKTQISDWSKYFANWELIGVSSFSVFILTFLFFMIKWIVIINYL